VTIDVGAAKRRLVIMGVINVLALLAAMGALVGYFRFHLGWALGAFAGLMLVGVGAPIWFIAGLARADKGA
jgi:hypothetical protein